MWSAYGVELSSHLILGTARYPSPQHLREAVRASGCEVVTVSLRRQSPESGGGDSFWQMIRDLKVRVLPNTAGCLSAKEAITTAKMARDLFDTRWIKLEVIGYEPTLSPDPFALVEAAQALCREGFEVFPYMTTDITLAEKLVSVGCRVLMPWASPIGSGQGIIDPSSIKWMRSRFPEIPIVIDAGIGRPSHAAQALELGADAVLLNTAVARANDPVEMARAFSLAVEAGRRARAAGCMVARENAVPSTPVIGTPFWRKD